MPTLFIVALIFVVLLVAIVFAAIHQYNNFVKLRNRVHDQESQIDVQLKRRCDLIPNLVETVKGCANFERETLESVVSARNHVLAGNNLADKESANRELSAALHHFIAISESYPELKSNANFSSLQQELSETEDKIAKSRQFYNDTVLKYNDAIQMFPASMIAGMTGFHKIDFLKITEQERENVKVQF